MTSRFIRFLIAAIAVAVMLPAFAQASWNSNGSGRGYSKANSVAAGNTPTTSVSNRSVTVNWTATGGGVPVTGYVVKRYSSGGALQTIGANCTGTVAGTSCTENSVPPGNWRYSVTPTRQNWRGNESGQSTAVTVNAPALSLSPNNVTSLPQVLTGQITNFVPAQTVTFRLDDQTTGTVLTGSISPSPVPANGTATVSVTLPSGVSNGSHTIYAIGSGSDVAAANVTVAVTPTTITTSAYDWRDASAGGAESNQSQELAFANDSRTITTGAWAGGFNASRYLEINLNSPLRGASTVSSAAVNLRLASPLLANACFYVEVRKASDNSLISTSGSDAAPFCTTSVATQTNFSVPVTGVTTGALANDLRLRIYGRSTLLGGSWTMDQASLSVAGNDGNSTLYPNGYTDAVDMSGAAFPWALAFNDSVLYRDLTNWQATYTSARYLKATFPAYVPAGATIQSATLTHVYRSDSANQGVCNYIEILDGSTVIGTHGSALSDLSCAPNASDVTDSIPLPEVNTVAEANNLVAKIYFRRNGNTRSQTNQVRLSVTYVK